MCGIIGILGKNDVVDPILKGLKRLEYRGYDSAGIATLHGGELDRRRATGKLNALEDTLKSSPLVGISGIGHTRWATHGSPTLENSHPHMTPNVALVHNGIIENFMDLKSELETGGVTFEGQSDTEVITRWLDRALTQGAAPIDAFKKMLSRLKGAFALAVLIKGESDLMLVARQGSPLVIGLGEGEVYTGSDAAAIAGLTNKVIYLEDGDSAILRRMDIEVFDENALPVKRPVTLSQAGEGFISKGNHRHYMHKEIFEQPTVVAQTLSRYIDFSQNTITIPNLSVDPKHIERITLVGCGTAYIAGHIAKYWIEQIAKTAADVDIASEFRYRSPVLAKNSLIIFISQSGETADTLAALKLAKQQGHKTLAVVNVRESSIAREADIVLPTYAGTEIGVASTKALTCQLAVLVTFALYLADKKGNLDAGPRTQMIKELEHLPAQIAGVLAHHEHLKEIAEDIATARDVLFVGRGIHYPVALEGALKLKEISYIHAEGYPAGELKHGPIALVDENVPVIALAPSHELFDKTISNIKEIEARKGRTIVVSDKPNGKSGTNLIPMPSATKVTSPILYTLPVQLISYYAAVAKGTDVDQPRNLAKSVTVE